MRLSQFVRNASVGAALQRIKDAIGKNTKLTFVKAGGKTGFWSIYAGDDTTGINYAVAEALGFKDPASWSGGNIGGDPKDLTKQIGEAIHETLKFEIAHTSPHPSMVKQKAASAK